MEDKVYYQTKWEERKEKYAGLVMTAIGWYVIVATILWMFDVPYLAAIFKFVALFGFLGIFVAWLGIFVVGTAKDISNEFDRFRR